MMVGQSKVAVAPTVQAFSYGPAERNRSAPTVFVTRNGLTPTPGPNQSGPRTFVDSIIYNKKGELIQKHKYQYKQVNKKI